VILAYNDDGPRHALLAMNGWQEGHPEWFLNLQANPDAVATLAHAAPTPVRARVAEGPERDRLWALLRDAEPHLDDYAQRRRTETPIVVLEPREPSALR
jgi:deazaflavin-dependent oxidoreductase (nitroreductase family)